MTVTFLYPQEESTDETLTIEDFMELEVTRDLQKALMARFKQKMNLIRLRNRLAGASEKRGDVLANIERNELLLEEVERYFDIRAKAFRKEIEEKGSHLDFWELWERIFDPVKTTILLGS